jgi:hypothetical protein
MHAAARSGEAVRVNATLLVRMVLVVQGVVLGVGIADAALADALDLVAIQALALALTVGLLATTTTRRPMVSLRGDLVWWLRARAATSGERLADVTDRAVAAYRAGIVGDDEMTRADGDAHVGERARGKGESGRAAAAPHGTDGVDARS